MRSILIFLTVTISVLADNSAIKEITIYNNNAYIGRKGNVALKKGSGKLLIGPLPIELDNTSLNFKFIGKKEETGAIKIQSVIVKEHIEKKFQNNRIKELRRKYKSLLQELNRIQTNLTIIDNHINSINNIQPELKKNNSLQDATTSSNPATRSQFISMIESVQKENLKLKTNILKELDDKREEFIIIGSILNNYKKAESSSYKLVEVEYDSAKIQDVSFFINYLLTGAYWYPRYEVNVDLAKKINYLKLYAIIKNNTGEDWKNVKIKLSTANPDFSFVPPELNEWHIGINEKYPDSKIASISQEKQKSSGAFGKKQARRLSSSMDKKRSEEYAEKSLDITNDELNFPSNSSPVSNKPTNQYSPLAVQQATGNILKNSYQSNRSVKTELEVNELQTNSTYQSTAFKRNDYEEAIQYGLKAKSSILLLSEKYGELLKDNKKEIDDLLQRSYFLKANYKIGKDLIAPNVTNSGYDTLYKIKLNQTILADNSLNKVFVTDEILASDYNYETSPISYKGVFLNSQSKSLSKLPYLAGPLDIFNNKSYLGTSRIQTTGPGFPIKMELGIDRDISVERRESVYSEKSGILTNMIVKNYTVKITLANAKTIPTQLTIIDRIPVSKDEKIKVELITTTDKPEWDEHTGILKFNINLLSGAKKNIEFTYSIKRPSNMLIEEAIGVSY